MDLRQDFLVSRRVLAAQISDLVADGRVPFADSADVMAQTFDDSPEVGTDLVEPGAQEGDQLTVHECLRSDTGAFADCAPIVYHDGRADDGSYFASPGIVNPRASRSAISDFV
jgi:hypothetical protein